MFEMSFESLSKQKWLLFVVHFVLFVIIGLLASLVYLLRFQILGNVILLLTKYILSTKRDMEIVWNVMVSMNVVIIKQL